MRASIPLVAAIAMAAVFAGLLAAVTYFVATPGRLVAAAPAALLQASPYPGAPASAQAGIVVTGEGSISVEPDMAQATLGVEVSAATANDAQQEAARQMDAVISELKKLGIGDKDIRTVQFNISPEYDHSTRSPVLKGYRATNLVQVTLRDISRVGDILDAVTAQGATRIHGIGFSVSNPAAAGQQGREEAMKQAREKAEQLARLGGVALGRPVAIEETLSAPPTSMDARQEAVMAAPDMRTPISPGTQEIRTAVRVVYSIQ